MNETEHDVFPEVDQLVIFPSWLQHLSQHLLVMVIESLSHLISQHSQIIMMKYIQVDNLLTPSYLQGCKLTWDEWIPWFFYQRILVTHKSYRFGDINSRYSRGAKDSGFTCIVRSRGRRVHICPCFNHY